MSGAVFAAGKGGSSFPFEIEFSVDRCDRICYAGHPNGTVIYKEGVAVTPETTFKINKKDSDINMDTSIGELSVTVSIIYENDHLSGSHKETIKEFNCGDLNLTDEFRLLSDNSIHSLEDRMKLYSDSLTGVEMTLINKNKDIKKKTIYLYVCSEDDYNDYLENTEYFVSEEDDAEEE